MLYSPRSSHGVCNFFALVFLLVKFGITGLKYSGSLLVHDPSRVLDAFSGPHFTMASTVAYCNKLCFTVLFFLFFLSPSTHSFFYIRVLCDPTIKIIRSYKMIRQLFARHWLSRLLCQWQHNLFHNHEDPHRCRK